LLRTSSFWNSMIIPFFFIWSVFPLDTTSHCIIHYLFGITCSPPFFTLPVISFNSLYVSSPYNIIFIIIYESPLSQPISNFSPHFFNPSNSLRCTYVLSSLSIFIFMDLSLRWTSHIFQFSIIYAHFKSLSALSLSLYCSFSMVPPSLIYSCSAIQGNPQVKFFMFPWSWTLKVYNPLPLNTSSRKLWFPSLTFCDLPSWINPPLLILTGLAPSWTQ